MRVMGHDWRDLEAEADREIEAAEERRRLAERARTVAAEDAEVNRLIYSSSAANRVRGYGLLIDLLLKRHAIAVRWLDGDRGACAYHSRRVVHIPRVQSAANLATCLHEIGHILIGPCPRTHPHRRAPNGCVQCELQAWKKAGAIWPFSLEMFNRLRTALPTYRDLPASPEVVAAADRTCSSRFWAEQRQRRLNFELRCDRQRAVAASLANR